MNKLPYQVRIIRELELMVASSKPLARFGDDVSALPDELIIPEKAFAPHAQSGQFLREEKR